MSNHANLKSVKYRDLSSNFKMFTINFQKIVSYLVKYRTIFTIYRATRITWQPWYPGELGSISSGLVEKLFDNFFEDKIVC